MLRPAAWPKARDRRTLGDISIWGYTIQMKKKLQKAPVDTKVSGSKMNKKKVAGDAIWADL